MTMVYPESVQTLANFKVLWVASIADTDEPTIAELTATAPAALDITCAIYGDTFQPTQNVNRSAGMRRACEQTSLERTTSVTRSIPDLVYAVDPQAAVASESKKVMETLTEGLRGYLVGVFGKASREPVEVGDFVHIYPVTLGTQLDQNPADDGAEFNVVQSVDLRGEIKRYREVLASA